MYFKSVFQKNCLMKCYPNDDWKNSQKQSNKLKKKKKKLVKNKKFQVNFHVNQEQNYLNFLLK